MESKYGLMVAYRQNPNIIRIEFFFTQKETIPCKSTPRRWLTPARKISLAAEFACNLIRVVFISRSFTSSVVSVMAA